MKFESSEQKNPSSGLVVVTADPGDVAIRLGPGSPAQGRRVRVDSDLPVFIDPGANVLSLHAPVSDVFASTDVYMQSLFCKSYTGDGYLYALMGVNVEKDVKLSGELKGERHFPYKIGGNLICDGVSVDGYVIVGGHLCTPWDDVRGLTVAGTRTTPDEVRAAGGVVLARPGFTPSGTDFLEHVRWNVSDRFLARSLVKLSNTQIAAAISPTGTPDAFTSRVAAIIIATATMKSEHENHDFDEPSLTYRALRRVMLEHNTTSEVRNAELIMTRLYNAALGTVILTNDLSPERAEDVKKYDGALHFLNTPHDEEDRHYIVEEVKQSVDKAIEAVTQDDLDEAVYAVISALADPLFQTNEAALRAAALRNEKVSAFETDILRNLLAPSTEAQDWTP